MSTSTPSAAHARLAQLVGSWEGVERLYPSPWMPEGGTATGRFESRMIGAYFLVQDYEQRHDDEVMFRGHGTYGYDAATDTYTMYWADSAGPAPAPAAGPWVGDTVTFQNRSPMGHHRYVYQVVDADRFRFRMESSTDGERWSPMLEGEYRRRA
jgi:hypothetical protein